MKDDNNNEVRAATRQNLKTKVDFYIDGDMETALSVDVSATGMRFETKEPFKVRMRLTVDGQLKEFYSRLVWGKKNPDGSMAYGFEFIPDNDECVF